MNANAMDLTELAPYLKLRKTAITESLGEGYFIAETLKVVEWMLSKDIEVVSIFGSSEWIDRLDADLLRTKVPLDKQVIRSMKEMESIVGFNLHQGLLAAAKRPADTPLEGLDARILALDGIQNPENVGSIVRSAYSLGFQSLLSDGRSADAYIRRAVRVSMGAVFEMKTHRSQSLVENLTELKNHGYRILGTDYRHRTAELANYPFPEKYVLIIGSEVHGMKPETRALCDDLLFSPTAMPLNASHAAAVFMYEASRRWGGESS